jgi:glycosyltransferase involved in cell wall biosynthesis
MKLSIFTPTHNQQYLLETYQSLLRQDVDTAFEWVIVLNLNGLTRESLPDAILGDSRAIIRPCSMTGTGALKNYACHKCTGDVLIELDHDDRLTPDAFSELAKAYSSEPGGFYYSDFVNVKPDDKCETLRHRHDHINRMAPTCSP